MKLEPVKFRFFLHKKGGEYIFDQSKRVTSISLWHLRNEDGYVFSSKVERCTYLGILFWIYRMFQLYWVFYVIILYQLFIILFQLLLHCFQAKILNKIYFCVNPVFQLCVTEQFITIFTMSVIYLAPCSVWPCGLVSRKYKSSIPRAACDLNGRVKPTTTLPSIILLMIPVT